MYSFILPFLAFAFVSSATPGPNNVMLLASGANFGFRRTLPHMLGISIGHSFQVALIGLGLLQLFNAYPASFIVMKVLSAAYLLYLAYKIANAAPPADAKPDSKPFTFLQAAAFQWVNPKALFMAITAQSQYAQPELGIWGPIAIALLFMAANFPAVSIWGYMGVQIKSLLSTPRRLRIFNYAMAGILIATLYPMLTADFTL